LVIFIKNTFINVLNFTPNVNYIYEQSSPLPRERDAYTGVVPNDSGS